MAAIPGSSHPPSFSCPVCRRVVVVRRPGLYGLSQEGLCGNGLVLSISSAARLAFGRGGGTVCIGSLTRLECSDLQKIVRRSRSDATSRLGGSKRCNQQAQRSNHWQRAQQQTTTLQRVVISRNAPWSLADQGGVALIACSTNSATRRL